VLRLLHQVQQALEPKALGMSAEQLACFNAVLHQPQGLILVTGPTGSGKTVTLYSALQARNTLTSTSAAWRILLRSPCRIKPDAD
jgi:protein transport protein HofB